MKFVKNACVLAAALGVAAAFDVVDLTASHRPHSVQINKRDTPAEIHVVDSDTVPVEDGAQSSKSLYKAPTSTLAHVVKNSGYAVAPSSTALKSSSEKAITQEDDDASGTSSSPFLMSISMIVVSEIGDKTFLIAALMAMRHSRALVFSASFASLAIMTILSGIVGHALPSLISQRVTQFLAAVLFIVFGVKLTKEGLAMSKDLGVDEELAEVEEEITISDINHDMKDVEAGGVSGDRLHQQTQFQQYLKKTIDLVNVIASQVFSPLWIQVFVMIFLGEWGDRSQIATIAMAAGSDYWPVIWGAVIGHGLCTGAAVVGGKMLASRISMRTVTLGGAFAFFVFSILYFYEALYSTEL